MCALWTPRLGRIVRDKPHATLLRSTLLAPSLEYIRGLRASEKDKYCIDAEWRHTSLAHGMQEVYGARL